MTRDSHVLQAWGFLDFESCFDFDHQVAGQASKVEENDDDEPEINITDHKQKLTEDKESDQDQEESEKEDKEPQINITDSEQNLTDLKETLAKDKESDKDQESEEEEAGELQISIKESEQAVKPELEKDSLKQETKVESDLSEDEKEESNEDVGQKSEDKEEKSEEREPEVINTESEQKPTDVKLEQAEEQEGKEESKDLKQEQRADHLKQETTAEMEKENLEQIENDHDEEEDERQVAAALSPEDDVKQAEAKDEEKEDEKEKEDAKETPDNRAEAEDTDEEEKAEPVVPSLNLKRPEPADTLQQTEDVEEEKPEANKDDLKQELKESEDEVESDEEIVKDILATDKAEAEEPEADSKETSTLGGIFSPIKQEIRSVVRSMDDRLVSSDEESEDEDGKKRKKKGFKMEGVLGITEDKLKEAVTVGKDIKESIEKEGKEIKAQVADTVRGMGLIEKVEVEKVRATKEIPRDDDEEDIDDESEKLENLAITELEQSYAESDDKDVSPKEEKITQEEEYHGNFIAQVREVVFDKAEDVFSKAEKDVPAAEYSEDISIESDVVKLNISTTKAEPNQLVKEEEISEVKDETEKKKEKEAQSESDDEDLSQKEELKKEELKEKEEADIPSEGKEEDMPGLEVGDGKEQKLEAPSVAAKASEVEEDEDEELSESEETGEKKVQEPAEKIPRGQTDILEATKQQFQALDDVEVNDAKEDADATGVEKLRDKKGDDQETEDAVKVAATEDVQEGLVLPSGAGVEEPEESDSDVLNASQNTVEELQLSLDEANISSGLAASGDGSVSDGVDLKKSDASSVMSQDLRSSGSKDEDVSEEKEGLTEAKSDKKKSPICEDQKADDMESPEPVLPSEEILNLELAKPPQEGTSAAEDQADSDELQSSGKMMQMDLGTDVLKQLEDQEGDDIPQTDKKKESADTEIEVNAMSAEVKATSAELEHVKFSPPLDLSGASLDMPGVRTPEFIRKELGTMEEQKQEMKLAMEELHEAEAGGEDVEKLLRVAPEPPVDVDVEGILKTTAKPVTDLAGEMAKKLDDTAEQLAEETRNATKFADEMAETIDDKVDETLEDIISTKDSFAVEKEETKSAEREKDSDSSSSSEDESSVKEIKTVKTEQQEKEEVSENKKAKDSSSSSSSEDDSIKVNKDSSSSSEESDEGKAAQKGLKSDGEKPKEGEKETKIRKDSSSSASSSDAEEGKEVSVSKSRENEKQYGGPEVQQSTGSKRPASSEDSTSSSESENEGRIKSDAKEKTSGKSSPSSHSSTEDQSAGSQEARTQRVKKKTKKKSSSSSASSVSDSSDDEGKPSQKPPRMRKKSRSSSDSEAPEEKGLKEAIKRQEKLTGADKGSSSSSESDKEAKKKDQEAKTGKKEAKKSSSSSSSSSSESDQDEMEKKKEQKGKKSGSSSSSEEEPGQDSERKIGHSQELGQGQGEAQLPPKQVTSGEDFVSVSSFGHQGATGGVSQPDVAVGDHVIKAVCDDVTDNSDDNKNLPELESAKFEGGDKDDDVSEEEAETGESALDTSQELDTGVQDTIKEPVQKPEPDSTLADKTSQEAGSLVVGQAPGKEGSSAQGQESSQEQREEEEKAGEEPNQVEVAPPVCDAVPSPSFLASAFWLLCVTWDSSYFLIMSHRFVFRVISPRKREYLGIISGSKSGHFEFKMAAACLSYPLTCQDALSRFFTIYCLTFFHVCHFDQGVSMKFIL